MKFVLRFLAMVTVALMLHGPVKAGSDADKAVADKLPDSIRGAGVIKIATTAYTPPIAFFGPDNKEIIGMMPISQKLSA